MYRFYMVERSAPLAQTERLFNLVPFIISNQGISIKKLASEFGVSVKEITADLNTLWMCGLPGYTPLELIDLEFDSGYVSIRNADILDRVRTLSNSEVIALQLGLGLIAPSLLSSDAQQDLLSVREKLSSAVGELAVLQPDSTVPVVVQLQKAISHRKDVTFTYLSGSDVTSTRRVTPIAVERNEKGAYLIAFCHLAQSQRTFRIEKIEDAQINDRDATIDPKITELYISAVENNRFAIYSDKRAVIESLSAASESDGLFSADVFNQEWFIRAVLAFGPSIEVVDNSELSEKIALTCSQILDLYS